MSEVENRNSATEKWSSGRSMDDLIRAFLGRLGNRHNCFIAIGYFCRDLLSLTSLQ
jgi:hypothetical protein